MKLIHLYHGNSITSESLGFFFAFHEAVEGNLLLN